MITTIQPTSRDDFPFRRPFRNQKPGTGTITTKPGVNTNEQDPIVPALPTALLSGEDLGLLVTLQEENAFRSARQPTYNSAPADESQISLDFIERTIGGRINQET